MAPWMRSFLRCHPSCSGCYIRSIFNCRFVFKMTLMETGSSLLKVPDVKGIFIYTVHQHVSICIYI